MKIESLSEDVLNSHTFDCVSILQTIDDVEVGRQEVAGEGRRVEDK